jgi:hypothetical protein
MTDTDDLSFIVLKGHLLIEEMLVELRDKLLPHSKYLDELNLSFRQLTSIVRAASSTQDINQGWDLIFMVNNVRNELIHNLEPDKIEKLLTKLFTIYRNVNVLPGLDRSREHLATASERLRWVIQDCMRFLASLLSSDEKGPNNSLEPDAD